MRSPLLRYAPALLWAIAASPTLAQTFFDTPRSFLVSRPCNASRSTRVERDPVPLTVGQVYTALGENGPTRRTHVFIQVAGEGRWVALSCGRYTQTVPALVDTAANHSQSRWNTASIIAHHSPSPRLSSGA